MTRLKTIIVAISIIFTIVGCAKIRIESTPSGADVRINGRNFGRTPTRTINIKKTYSLEVAKEGYETYFGTISTSDISPYIVTLEEKAKEKAGLISVHIVSDDGEISVTKEQVHAETDTIERSPNVKSVRKITNLSEFSWLGGFQLSPDGRNIIFQQYEEERIDNETSRYSNLWSASTSVGPIRRITQGKFFDRSPSFSPDGENILFSSNRLDTFDLWKLSYSSGGGLGLKTNSSTMHEDYPSLANDNKTILFSSIVKGAKIKQIWTLGTENSELFQLREGQWPHWFDGGSKIIFSSLQRTTGEWKIWTMGKDGSNPIQISTSDGSNDIHASVSPNGDKIVFASDRAMSNGKKNYDIWISDLDGSNLTQLTTNGSIDDHPVFGPDNRTIYFRSNRGVKWDIWAMKLAI